MAHTTSTTPAIEAKPATGRGDIGGYRVSCPCGFTFTSSLLGIAQADARDHVAYMLRKEQGARRSRKAA